MSVFVCFPMISFYLSVSIELDSYIHSKHIQTMNVSFDQAGESVNYLIQLPMTCFCFVVIVQVFFLIAGTQHFRIAVLLM